MKKRIIIVTTIMILAIGMFFMISKVYGAENRAIDKETESKIVEIKSKATNSIEDYKEKYRF